LESSVSSLGAIKWDGTTFTLIGTSTIAADITVATYECFDIEFSHFGDPLEFTTQAEFTGTSDLGNWTSLTWSIDSAWSASNVTVTFQLFDYNLGAYPTSGDGYLSYNSSVVPYIDEIKNQTIITNPTRFRDGSGQWKIKATGVKVSSAQLDMEADMIELRLPASGPSLLFRNSGTVTSHIVSLWVINSSVHQRYDVSVYLNSGEDIVFHRNDISIPSGQYTVRIVTDKGNLAAFSGS
jgi:hypothetical protein